MLHGNPPDPSPPRKGRPPRISLTAILDAAETLSPDALTMSAVARHLGVATSALYTHVRDREELLGALAERLGAELRAPEEDLDWRTWLRTYARDMYAALGRHPVLTRPETAFLIQGKGAVLVQTGLRVLRGEGFDGAQALNLLRATGNVAYMQALADLLLQRPGFDGAEVEELIGQSIPRGADSLEEQLDLVLAAGDQFLARQR
ncbi:TetR/AcrR family transcriptional regulator [Lentzea sp. NPDC058436]|uniref:TetR/AcrR family transcriptional regulator n=1 Tax=Lentzea sp. NPDC058436 TaxID=3346499 RepID=UPI003666AE0E